jgi:tRNA threonylcarbamoyladenosine biosynthesis protein TsaE
MVQSGQNLSSEQTIFLPNQEATLALGQKLGQTLSVGSVILLEGDLGAGKTTLIQGLGLGLGIREAIVSPTFTLVNEYYEGRLPLYHLDLYRLEGAEIASIYPENYWEGIEYPPGITAIEWAQLLPYKPETYLDIQLNHDLEGGRWAKIHNFGLETWQLT